MRPSWYFINCCIVWIISLLSTCTRLHVGALLWHPITKQLVAIGYNGAPKGRPHCLDDGCEMKDGHCVRCLHAEDNVFYWAGTDSIGCVLFLNYLPCRRCCNKIIQGQVIEVVYTHAYGDSTPIRILLNGAGIKLSYYGHWRLFAQLLNYLRLWWEATSRSSFRDIEHFTSTDTEAHEVK